MGTETFHAEAKAAGTRVRGSVYISVQGSDEDDVAYDIGDAIVTAIETAAEDYEPIDDAQPLAGDVLDEITQIAIMAQALVKLPMEKGEPNDVYEWADSLISLCSCGLDREPRFAQAYGYALAMAAQAAQPQGKRQGKQDSDIPAALAAVLPQPIRPTGKEALVMRVDMNDLQFRYPKDGSGLARIEMVTRHVPMSGEEAKQHKDEAGFFPVPLFDDAYLGAMVETQFVVENLVISILLETHKPAYGVLRAVLRAVEEVVDDYTAF